MKKYFVYDNEYISGWRYWWRMFLQSYLIAFFGLGAYLAAVTTYKRAKSLNLSDGWSLTWAIYHPISYILGFAIGIEIGASGDESLWVVVILLSIPHLYLWFSDGVPPNKVHDSTIKEESNSQDGLPTHLGGVRLENDNTTELPKKEKTSTQKTEILTKNNEDMKGFKQCDKGHFYKDTLAECNYCPKTGSAGSGDETEILGANDQTFDNPTEKTQVFGGATQQSPSSKESFDPERTIISGGNTSSAAGDAQDQITQKRKLRAWLVSFDIEDFGIDFKVNEGKNTMGSKSSNDITIQDSQVSGLQGIILCKKDKFYITDEVSSNGTLLNGEDLEPRKPYDIKDGDEIKVGNTNLLFKTAFKK